MNTANVYNNKAYRVTSEHFDGALFAIGCERSMLSHDCRVATGLLSRQLRVVRMREWDHLASLFLSVGVVCDRDRRGRRVLDETGCVAPRRLHTLRGE